MWRLGKHLKSGPKDGRVRAIGSSNFMQEHVQKLLDTCEIKPMADQI